MRNRETVLTALEICNSSSNCTGCAYFREDRKPTPCTVQLLNDVIGLLKRETAAPEDGATCPVCRSSLLRAFRYCPCCGTAINWEATA